MEGRAYQLPLSVLIDEFGLPQKEHDDSQLSTGPNTNVSQLEILRAAYPWQFEHREDDRFGYQRASNPM
ncbi:peptidylprolyl isomerase [Anopheles sinensis]|uniref:Peptidylprolyl isomerase n=1 Tax=Anopheles sinensis TaxID=74873 RepID=A0A084VAH7_ANOSI|nr:peptidylprolyl isomerase [Anopheles sinensis]